MTIRVESSPAVWESVVGHLRGAPERVAFFVSEEVGSVVTISEFLLVDDSDLEPGPWCVQLTDEAQQKVLRWAAQRDGWLVEAHSHLGRFGDPAELSPTDTEGLSEWVPHVRWRLRQRPYAALVFGPATIDGVAWSGPRGAKPVVVGAWCVGESVQPTTGLSIRDLGDRT